MQKEKLTKIIICIIIALIIALISWLNTVANMPKTVKIEKYELKKHELNLSKVGEGWYPWKLTEDGDHQEMPKIESNTSHERFKEMANKYWLDASKIRQVEQYYWLTEAVVLCITVSETSWWNRWAWGKNIWSVGSNDRWDRPTYALMESWLEAIWKTLTNRYLWSIKTLGCLSNAWSCQSRDDNWKRYATSDYNWEANMKSCLSAIYWPIDPATFNIRNR